MPAERGKGWRLGLAVFAQVVALTLFAAGPAPAQQAAASEATTACGQSNTAAPDSEACGSKRAPAAPLNLRAIETFSVEYVGDNGPSGEALVGDDDDFWIARNSLFFQADNAAFESGARLDLTLFQGPPGRVGRAEFIPGGSGYTTLNYGNDLRVERLYGTLHQGDLHVTAGDFYVSFGRGVALSLIKLDDVGVDNSLRGARIEYHLPRRFKAVIVGGAVGATNIDPLTRQVLEDDPLDRIAGARVEWELLDALSLGAHGVLLKPRFDREAQISPERIYLDQSPGVAAMSAGASAELNAAGFHVALEGNGQIHDNYRPVGKDVLNERGWAFVGEVAYDLPPLNLKAEGILYRRWLMEGPYRGSSNYISAAQPLSYNHAVTLEPLWMPIKSFGNADGGRLTFDLLASRTDTQLVLATALLHYRGGVLPSGEWGDHPETLAVHPILTLRQEFPASGVQVVLNGGMRYENARERQLPGAPHSGTLAHAATDLTVPLGGPHSIEAKVEVRRHALMVTEGENYWVTSESLGYDLASVFGLSVVHEFCDQTAGTDVAFGSFELPLPRQHYAWALLSYHAPEPLGGLTLRLLAGSQRGGIKCAGGVCRTYPDSVGAKLEAVYRF